MCEEQEAPKFDTDSFVELLFFRGQKSFFDAGVIPYEELVILLKLKLMSDALLKFEGNITNAARFLHIRRSTLAEFIRSYSIICNPRLSIAENFRLSVESMRGHSLQEYRDLVKKKRIQVHNMRKAKRAQFLSKKEAAATLDKNIKGDK